MRVWIDCEWNGYEGDLISMALVDEDGVEWYEVLGCASPDPWVKKHVIPVLNKKPISWGAFQQGLADFLGRYNAIHLVADWPEDVSHFCNSLILGPGMRIDTPSLTIEIVRVDASSSLPHNALSDAHGIRRAMQ